MTIQSDGSLKPERAREVVRIGFGRAEFIPRNQRTGLLGSGDDQEHGSRKVSATVKLGGQVVIEEAGAAANGHLSIALWIPGEVEARGEVVPVTFIQNV